MRDFYAVSQPAPLDQADGLRRMFQGHANQQQRVLPLLANPHVAFSGVLLDRMASVLAASGREVLVVDAGGGAPAPAELAELDLAAGIERVAQRVSYLPARGLPLRHVDTRGSAAGFISAVQSAAPWADVVLLHAEPAELARVLLRRAARPVLIGADHPESIKHAYASAKLLAQRCGLMTFDLLLAASPSSPRVAGITASLGQCLDGFLGALLQHAAVVDPACDPAEPCNEDLRALLVGQLMLEDTGWDPAAPMAPTAAHGQHAGPHAAAAQALHRFAS